MPASSSAAPSVYDTPNLTDVTPPQMAFPSNYNFEQDPVAAMTSYSKTMHQHTMRQMEAAATSARRRSQGLDSQPFTMSAQDAMGSMSSTTSA